MMVGASCTIPAGHLHLIRRASRMVDKLIIAVADSPKKGPLFSHDERLEMLRADIENMRDNNDSFFMKV